MSTWTCPGSMPRTPRAKGGPPYDPRLMVRILLYGYTTGVRSSRAAGGGDARGRGRVPVAGRRGGTGLPVDRAVPQAAPGRAGAPVRAGVGVVPGGGHGQAGPGGAGRDEAAGERLAAQGDELRADDGEGEDPRRAEVVDVAGARPSAIDKAEDSAVRQGRAAATSCPRNCAGGETRLATIREAKPALEDEAAERARDEAERRARERGEDEDTAAGGSPRRRDRGHAETEGAAQLHRPGVEDHEDRRTGRSTSASTPKPSSTTRIR